MRRSTSECLWPKSNASVSVFPLDTLTEEWTDLSFVERQRIPEWAIQVGIRCHLAGMSTRYAGQFLEELGVNRSHIAIHNWVHKTDLQPISTVSAD